MAVLRGPRGASLPVVAAGGLVGLLAGATDLARMVGAEAPEGLAWIAAGAVGLLVALGLGLGAVVVLLLRLGDLVAATLSRLSPRALAGLGPAWEGPWTRLARAARAAIDAGLLVPAVYVVGRKVFAGRGLAASSFADAGPWLFLAATLGGAVVASAVLRALAPRIEARRLPVTAGATVAGLALAAALIGAERTQQVEAYFYLHVIAVVLAACSALWALHAALLPALRRLGPLTVGGAALLAAGVAASGFSDRNEARLFLHGTHMVTTIATEGVRSLWDLDRDGYSPLLGGGDCDDLDPGRHPLRADAPGGGDADCDGVPGAPPAPPPAAPPLPAADGVGPLRERLRGANVVFIVVDALRADWVLGPRVAAFPALRSLAEGSVRWTDAWSTSASTRYAVPAMFHGALRLEQTGPSLLGRLRDGGWQTAFVLLARADQVFPDLLRQVEDVVRTPTDTDRHPTGDKTTADALAWLDRRDPERPFALAVHYLDAHQWHRIDDPATLAAEVDGGPAGRYDRVVGMLDGSIGALLEGLRTRGLDRDAVVVLVADHGEALGERGNRTHARQVYPGLTRVPVLIRAPGLPPRDLTATAGVVDIAPTLLDLLGLPPLEGADGLSLAPALVEDVPVPERPLYMVDREQVGVVAGAWMLVHTPQLATVELLRTDAWRADVPAHRADLSRQHPDVTARLLGWLRLRFDAPFPP